MMINNVRIREIIQKSRGLNGHNWQGLSDTISNERKIDNLKGKPSNLDMILLLVLNAHRLGFSGMNASLCLTLAQLVAIRQPMSQKNISQNLSVGVSTLERHLSRLHKLGFIEIEKVLDDRGFSRNVYRFAGLRVKLRALGVDA